MQAAEEVIVNTLAANQDMTVRSVTQTQAYDVRYGPGHRPRVITKAVGGRGGGGTMGRPGP